MKHSKSILESSTFLPNIIKIDSYNFELYRFKVGSFFETQFMLFVDDGQQSACSVSDK